MPRTLHLRFALSFGLVAVVTGCAGGDVDPATCPIGTQANAEGRCLKTCSLDSQCLVDQVCTEGLCQAPPAGRATVLLFTAEPRTVQPEGRVRVRYSVANATRVQVAVTDSSGNQRPIADERNQFVGFADTDPLIEDVTISLLVFEGDQFTTTNIDIDVVEDDTLSIDEFTATPAVVRPGQLTRLSWQVTNGVGAVRITAEETGAVVLNSGPLNGFHDTPVEAPTTFMLAVEGTRGQRLEAPFFVDVDTGAGVPVISRFEVTPSEVALGDTSVASWQTTGADRVILRLNSQTGPVIYDSRNPAYVAAGEFVVAPAPLARNFVLQAFGRDGAESRTASVQLGAFPTPPTITSFDTDPDLFLGMLLVQEVDFSWRVVPTDARLRLFDGNSVTDVTGRTSFAKGYRTNQTIVFELEASNADGAARAIKRVWDVVEEVEPNNIALTAQPLTGTAVQGALVGELMDVDRMGFDVPAMATVRASFLTGSDTCDRNVRLELYQGQRRVAEKTAGERGECPTLVAGGLTGARYQIVLSAPGSAFVFRYVLGIAVDEPRCGDGVVLSSTEQCDDGNLLPGDGCSPTCTLEPDFIYTTLMQPFDGWDPPDRGAQQVSWLPYKEGQMSAPSDEGFAVIDLPFPFRFFGRRYAGVIVHANGFVSLLPDYEDAEIKPRAPWGSARPNAVVAVVAADLIWDEQSNPTYWFAAEPQAGRTLWIDFSGARVRGANDGIGQARLGLTTTGLVFLRYGQVSTNRQFVAGIEGPVGNFQYPHPNCPDTGCGSDADLSNTMAVFRNTSN